MAIAPWRLCLPIRRAHHLLGDCHNLAIPQAWSLLCSEEHRKRGIRLVACPVLVRSLASATPRKALSRKQFEEVLDWVEGQRAGIDSRIYASLLRYCGSAKVVTEGRRLHEHIAKSGREGDTFLGNLLVEMYGKFGLLWDARAAFDKIRRRNAFSLSVMIVAYTRNGQGKEGVELFRRMQREGVKLDATAFVSVLGTCAGFPDLTEGKIIHASIVASGLQSEIIVGTSLVSMYGRCGSAEDARNVFDKMALRDVVSWNAMITGYAQNGNLEEAFRFFLHMQQEGVEPNRITFANILAACTNLEALTKGKLIHACIVVKGFESDVVVENFLISMYGRCGSLEDARNVFQKMHLRVEASWNAIISAYGYNGYGNRSLDLFRQMQQEGLKPSGSTFLCVLGACASPAALAEGKLIHANIVSCRLESDIVVGTALVNMYGKCGNLQDARSVFEKTHPRDVVSWTAMINVYVQNGHGGHALELFQQMQHEATKPNIVTFVSILGACAGPTCLKEGKEIHASVIASGFESDDVVQNALVNMYGKCGSLEDARSMFDRIFLKDVVSWNAMISAYGQNGHCKQVLVFLCQMLDEGVKPDNITFVNVVGTCAWLQTLPELNVIHASIISNEFESDVVVGTALVNMYGKGGYLEAAKSVFEKIYFRDLASWNAIIAAYGQNGHGKESLHLFWQMQYDGFKPDNITAVSILSSCTNSTSLTECKAIHASIIACQLESDVVVENALVNVYGKCGSSVDARGVFEKMHHRNVISWNAMISAYCQNGHGKEALELFFQMQQEGMNTDSITSIAILSACASVVALREGKMMHASIVASGLEQDTLENALVNMYGKCGNLEDARSVFDNMHCRNVVSWNTMIAAYGQNGQGKEAVELFQHMQEEGVKPNATTFVSILSACSHTGLVDEGFHYFSMCREYGVIPIAEHYGCMIDLLGRAGLLDEAEDLVNSMPFQPDAVQWGTLLGVCTIHSDVERGARAAENAFELDPMDAGPYVMLSNIYAASGRWGDAANIRRAMKDRCVKKQPGCSLIEVNGA